MSRAGAVLLDVEDLHVAYGKAHVVHGVSLAVHEGEFVVVLGRNGAGKSTILHALSGLIPKQRGRVRFAGVDITRASPGDIVRAGLVQVLEGHRVFTTLSVEDNLRVGTYAGREGASRETLERIYADFPELAERRHQQASRLSGGQQQILAVAQGLIAGPRLLILDEPSGGLAPIVVDRILEVAARLARAGTAILLVEQLVEKALRHAGHGYLLDAGAIAGEGSAGDLQDSALLRRIYLGGTEAA
ncbi:ABC transporter ATP-binding protein [Methylobacterium sp. SyP6R]|uniref:ABC transporter ATP-binding protein n=1 Tax=Methylobacterium sp. SyP6R TaxID=2718876 RepID=UPI001F396D4C|nr:ABC transporter ATP-binding protein [Methylobacterium sp. SyP6R]MCF4129641.1 ABC transporter ATP-binding protein [Methylobacterium sp. SyP6R]